MEVLKKLYDPNGTKTIRVGVRRVSKVLDLFEVVVQATGASNEITVGPFPEAEAYAQAMVVSRTVREQLGAPELKPS